MGDYKKLNGDSYQREPTMTPQDFVDKNFDIYETRYCNLHNLNSDGGEICERIYDKVYYFATEVARDDMGEIYQQRLNEFLFNGLSE